jgi:hypothetical protein
MPITTNLYADKILSEHPLAVWSLDDTADYISLISEPFRQLSTWTAANGTVSNVTNTQRNLTAPFPSSFVTQIGGTSSPTTVTSSTTFTSDSGGFTVSFYIQSSTDVTINVGYTGITSQTEIVYGSKYPTLTWVPVSFTFSNQATAKNLKIEFVYTSTTPTFYINGLTIGKNSEPFNGESFGQTLATIPSNIATTQTAGIESKSYGNQSYSAYYIGSGKDLYAKNAGMSLSYGSANSAIIYPHPTAGQPSFIMPGFGFLNENGRYKQLTLEMMIRINANNSVPKRIIGPLASTDGVYVTKEFISLKVGEDIKSYYLSELNRPILLQVIVAENYAVLAIDGDDVISLPIDSSTLVLPSKLDGSSDDQDWIGFFAYSDVKFLEVDSIAIYPYKCSSVLSKMRLAYAQALDVPLDINIKYGGDVILADFGFANYTNNYNYPSFQAKWEQASIIDNFDISPTQTLSTKSYAVPDVAITGTTSLYTLSDWLKDLYLTNVAAVASGDLDVFINLRPTTSGSGKVWSTNQGYLYSSSFNKNEHLASGIYGVFKSLTDSGTEQILFEILNESTNDYLKVSLTNTTVSYKIKYNGTESTITTKSITHNEKFAVGIDIKSLVTANTDVASFLSDINSLNLYVGGDNLTSNTFTGNIYKVGLCSSRNFADISSLFASGILTDTAKTINLQTPTIASGTVTITTTTPHGFRIGDRVTISTVQPVGYRGNFTVTAVPSTTSFSFTNATTGNITTAGTVTRIFQSVLLERTATYTIGAINAYEKIILDISTNSYWQDYVPLNKLSRTTNDASGNPIQELDFVQINIDYPETKTYASGNFDTSDEELKSYITFQRLSSGAIKNISEFASTIAADDNRVIDASTPNETSKYEFVNGMVIYPPRPEITELDWDKWAIVFHVELNNSASNLKPYQIRHLQIAAKTLDYAPTVPTEQNPVGTKYNPIGTRHSVDLYPYIYSGGTYDYKSKNPYLVYKQSTPYLYLTKHSGIRFCGDYNSSVDRGIFFEMGNPSLNIKINSIQMSLLADIQEFPTTAVKILEIVSKNETIPFYLKSINASNTKGRIYTESTTNIPIYYLNGKIVAEPVLELDEWNFLGLSFLNPIDISETVGKIKITSNILIDNVSFYGLDTENNSQKITVLSWSTVDNGAWNALTTWQYTSLSDYYRVYDNGMKEIFKTYTGTNKILADTSSNTKNIEFNGYKYIGYMDIERNTITLNIA